MRKGIKVGALLLSGIVVLESFGLTTALAASSVSGELNGRRCYGSVDYAYVSSGTCDGVTARTSFAGEGAQRVWVKARAYYYDHGKRRTEEASTSGTYGASATAWVKGAGTVVGGKGYHEVIYQDIDWKPQATKIGETWVK